MSDLHVTDPVLDKLPTFTGEIPNDGDNSRLKDHHSDILIPIEAALASAYSLGINANQRTELRRVVLRSARVHLLHAAAAHYTEGSLRWWGITHQDRSIKGQFPLYSDCSSAFTFWHWDASRWLKLGDYLNGAGWTAGYTGTLAARGVRIDEDQLMAGDAVFYGGSLSVPAHVAVALGDGRVISNGSEVGPLLLPTHYRPDVIQFRAFIR